MLRVAKSDKAVEENDMKKGTTPQAHHGEDGGMTAPFGMTKRRTFFVALGMSAATVAIIGIATTHGLEGQNEMTQQQDKSTKFEKNAQGSSMTTVTTNSNTQGSNSESSHSKTHVFVNNQPVDIPENGSMSKTITGDSGTTQINVSNNSSSDGTSVSSSITSNNISMSTNTFSHDVNINNSSSP